MMTTQKGFTLSELLISMFLVSFIMTLSIQFYVHHKRYYLQLEQLINQQHDLNWVQLLISTSVRHAGYTPCLSLNQLTRTDTRDPQNPMLSIAYSENNLKINRMSEYFNGIISIKNRQEVEVTKTHTLHEHHPIIIADCMHAEIHIIKHIRHTEFGQILSLEAPLNYLYSKKAYIGDYIEDHWHIKKKSNGKNALYYQAEEISAYIKILTIVTKKIHTQNYLDISLGMAENDIQHFQIAVRAA